VDRRDGSYLSGTWTNDPENNFSYTRVFEDTDSEYVVAHSSKGYFIIDSTIQNLSKKQEDEIVYFGDFYWCLSPSEAGSDAPRFLMQTLDEQIVLVDVSGSVPLGQTSRWIV